MTKLRCSVLLILLACICNSDAHAGLHYGGPSVSIWDSSGTTYAYGLMGVRYTADNLQYVGCNTWGYGGVCQFQDAAGRYVGCWIQGSNTSALQALSALTSFSEVSVSISGGNCVGAVAVSNSSYWLP